MTHSDEAVRLTINPVKMPSPFKASDVTSLASLEAVSLPVGEKLAKDYPSVLACYVNSGPGCPYMVDVFD